MTTSTEIKNEILRRRDMRDAFTFTIDPADAKDFDDALSFEILSTTESDLSAEQSINESGLSAERSITESDLSAERSITESNLSAERSITPAVYRIGVHIADVSFYVRPNTKVDDDAYKRGTSVYLVDRVLPMLPEELCNDKCSLRPDEDKLCMSVIFTMDADAHVLKYKICRTVIRSNVRLNYDEAQSILENETTTRRKRDENETTTDASVSVLLRQAITTINALALKLRAERIAAGALTIEQDETRFRLDQYGNPVEIYFEKPNEAHHLIEEFMLLANRTVAKAVGSGRPFVYRVHDLPDGEKMDAVKTFARKMGKRVSQQAIDLLTIRAQAKAVYSTYNIGHYGLAFTHYTHFTSPIRRYPDLMVHRLVEKYILTGKKESMTREELEEKCEHCSACEQEAAQAERDSVKLFQTMWMSNHVGEILPGHISGVTDFGLFVQLDESRCEGLVHITHIGEKGEYWQYDEKNYRLVCENKSTDNCYTLGDPIWVKVVRTDINKSQIDLEIVEKDEISNKK